MSEEYSTTTTIWPMSSPEFPVSRKRDHLLRCERVREVKIFMDQWGGCGRERKEKRKKKKLALQFIFMM